MEGTRDEHYYTKDFTSTARYTLMDHIVQITTPVDRHI